MYKYCYYLHFTDKNTQTWRSLVPGPRPYIQQVRMGARVYRVATLQCCQVAFIITCPSFLGPRTHIRSTRWSNWTNSKVLPNKIFCLFDVLLGQGRCASCLQHHWEDSTLPVRALPLHPGYQHSLSPGSGEGVTVHWAHTLPRLLVTWVYWLVCKWDSSHPWPHCFDLYWLKSQAIKPSFLPSSLVVFSDGATQLVRCLYAYGTEVFYPAIDLLSLHHGEPWPSRPI